jgi:hypothetical protein
MSTSIGADAARIKILLHKCQTNSRLSLFNEITITSITCYSLVHNAIAAAVAPFELVLKM